MRKIAIIVLCICLFGCGTVKKILKREPKEETAQAVLEDLRKQQYHCPSQIQDRPMVC